MHGLIALAWKSTSGNPITQSIQCSSLPGSQSGKYFVYGVTPYPKRAFCSKYYSRDLRVGKPSILNPTFFIVEKMLLKRKIRYS